jgi:hypothetical protein
MGVQMHIDLWRGVGDWVYKRRIEDLKQLESSPIR